MKKAYSYLFPYSHAGLFTSNYLSKILVILGMGLSFTSSAQKIKWDKTIGGESSDFLTSIQNTPDSGFVLGGTSSSGKSGEKTQDNNKDQYGLNTNDYWIVKLNTNGTKQWDKTFGGNVDDNLSIVMPTKDGGYILGGSSSSGKSGDKTEANKGETDFWVIKVNADGTKVWDKTIGGNKSDNLTTIVQSTDGGYLLGGTSKSGKIGNKTEINKGSTDYWVVKLQPDGTKEWDRTIGGKGEDGLASLQLTSDGGYILGGSSFSPISFDKTEASQGVIDFWIVKLRSDGSKEWDKTIGGNNIDYLETLRQTNDGGYILGGFSESDITGSKTEASKGSTDYWVVKLRSDGSKEWDKTIGGDWLDYLYSIELTPDGGYILGGNSSSNMSGDKSEDTDVYYSDFWIVKLRADGTKQWDKTFGTPEDDYFATIQQTNDGNYILGGSNYADISEDKTEPSRGGFDYWVIKLEDKVYNATAWNQRYGGTDFDNFTTAIQTTDGGYLAGGYSASNSGFSKSQNSQGKNDFWLVKTDQYGEKIWDKTYGGSEDDFLNRVIQTQDGGYLLTGSSFSGKSGYKTQPSRGNRDFWIVKISAQGTKQWDKRYGGSGSDELLKVIQLATGEYILAGNSNSSAGGDKSQNSQGGSDYWLVKISSKGEKLWDKRYGGSLGEDLASIIITRDKGFLLVGSSLSGFNGDKGEISRGNKDYWIVKTDEKGIVQWNKTFGGSANDQAATVGRFQGDIYFIAGTSASGKSGDKSQANQGGTDYWVIKFDLLGNKIWDKTFGGQQNDELRAGTFTKEGNYVLAGSSFSGASGDKTQSNQGGSDYWLLTLDQDGNKIWDKRFGGSRTDELRSVIQTIDGGFLLGGRSDSGETGDKSQPAIGFSGPDFWLVKIPPVTSTSSPTLVSRSATALPSVQTNVNYLTAYPNPFTDKVTINFTLPETQAVTVKIYNSQGQEVKTLFQGKAKARQTYQLEWQAGNKPAGLYFMGLQTPTTRQDLKLLLAN
ncbi:T9SS type A sorting domain-containing protein [Adhaeribacter radiodurans]|uniref:T9SS type A sorting domain-containing protein n=1 Tax=Adhaeribacter radiodurans TaxID=2745197 RepID=A0A7L7L9W4_9BACT|nr:T9SS type A sorting domain-containing protein [Adhaeribacter radiodurans]QMU29527.1 T9SS type A sorting domain-containing protein [Adhaeribacter radiodurans]